MRLTQPRTLVSIFIFACLIVLVALFARIHLFSSDTVRISSSETNKYLSIVDNYLPDESTEADAVNTAINNSHKWYQSRTLSNNSSQTILCVAFIELNEANMIQQRDNMERTKHSCFWVYMIYKYDLTRKQDLIDQFNTILEPVKVHNDNTMKKKYDIEFLPPRSEILSDIADKCKDIKHTTLYNDYNLDNICNKIISTLSISINSTININNINNYNNKINPKIIHFIRLLWRLPEYQYVWIIDGDITLTDFNLTKFLTILSCAFEYKPIITQPLIIENTQSYPYINHKNWVHNKAIATETGFIEIQVPMLNTQFLSYYIMKFVFPIVIPMHILGADWGFDELFCSAAKLYSTVITDQFQLILQQHQHQQQQLLLSQSPQPVQHAQYIDNTKNNLRKNDVKYEQYEEVMRLLVKHRHILTTTTIQNNHNNKEKVKTHKLYKNILNKLINNSPNQCIIILANNTSIHHSNSKITNAILGYNMKKTLNDKLRNILKTTFSSFYFPGKDPKVNPLISDTKYKKSYQLQNNCIF